MRVPPLAFLPWLAAALAIVAFPGCSESSPPIESDAGVLVCTSDFACRDGVFCNGAEICAPGNSLADARGCLTQPTPCDATERCDEAAAECRALDCADGDVDLDGHLAVGCGGDDCDDADPNRYPGNAEVCDDQGHDEDCDPCTVSAGSSVDGDTDVDSYPSSACWNSFDLSQMTPACDVSRLRFDTEAMAVVGRDCDDTSSSVHPAVVGELCDDVDNDCDGEVDEGVLVNYVCDGDGDGHLPPTGVMSMMSCQPPTAPCSGQWIPRPAPNYFDDCDDTDLAVFGSNVELCDGKDNDCDPTTWAPREDDDDDGFISYQCGGDDCDDTNARTNPDAIEVCNHVLDRCGGVIDDGLTRYCSGGPTAGYWLVNSTGAGGTSVGGTLRAGWFRSPFDIGTTLSFTSAVQWSTNQPWGMFVSDAPAEMASGYTFRGEVPTSDATSPAIAFLFDGLTNTLSLESIGSLPARVSVPIPSECQSPSTVDYDVLWEFDPDGSVDLEISAARGGFPECFLELSLIAQWQRTIGAPVLEPDGSRSARDLVLGFTGNPPPWRDPIEVVQTDACGCF